MITTQPLPSNCRCLQSHYLATVVVYLPLLLSLPSRGSTCHNIKAQRDSSSDYAAFTFTVSGLTVDTVTVISDIHCTNRCDADVRHKYGAKKLNTVIIYIPIT